MWTDFVDLDFRMPSSVNCEIMISFNILLNISICQMDYGLSFIVSFAAKMPPFSLFVRTDQQEIQDGENSGFSLNYRQTIC